MKILDFFDRTLKRLDHYVNATNYKSIIIIIVNIIISGLFLLCYYPIIEIFNYPPFALLVPYIYFVVLFGIIMSTIYAFVAFFTYFQTEYQNNQFNSLFFFGSAGKMELSDYMEKSEALDEESFKKDLVIQLHTIAKGVRKKYLRLQRSLQWLFFFTILPIFAMTILKSLEFLIK